MYEATPSKLTTMVKFRKKTVHKIADMICGNNSEFFKYRTSSALSEFFEHCEMEQYVHGSSTRKWWVVRVLDEILNLPSDNTALPGTGFQTVIQVLMDRADCTEQDPEREAALKELNRTLVREGLEAFYAGNNLCYIRNTKTGEEARPSPVVDRVLSKEESDRYARLEGYIESASEDELTEYVLVPLYKTLGFQRISITGHKDKAMEFGKDIWMKYRLPIGHWLYFGLQVKCGKIDAAAKTKNENIAEVHRQVTMMLGHKIFDPDINKERLVYHAIIVAGGEITKHARNWLGGRLDASQRSQIIFMDRTEILHLFIVYNVPMPDENQSEDTEDWFPF